MIPKILYGWAFPVVALGLLAACSAERPAVVPAVPDTPPAGMQYLYGSGEASALSIQAYQALLANVASKLKARPVDSVVLAEGARLDDPRFVPCGDKPFAAVFDVDETVMLNIGYEYHAARTGQGFDAAAWDAWEKTGQDAVAPVPGADQAMRTLRGMGVTVIFNTNRSAAHAEQTRAAVKAAGLGDVVHGDTLYLSGDDAMGSRKDGRRATIAARYCVIAMGGDQLGDFSDLFNGGQSVTARRAATLGPAIAKLWGNGWFMLPNPVYGSGLKGGFDDIFPMDKRWDMPAAKEAN